MRPGSRLVVVLLLVAGLATLCADSDAARRRRPRARPATTPLAAPLGCMEVRYEGTLDLEGHFRRPGETRRYRSRQYFLEDGRGGVRLDWTTWAEGDSAGEPETFLIAGDAVFHRDAPGAAWERWTGERAEEARLEACAGMPWLFERDPRLAAAAPEPAAARATERGVPRVTGVRTASLPGRLRRVTEAEVGRRATRIVRIEDQRAHPRLGDVTDSVAYEWDGSLAPAAIDMGLQQSGSGWRLHAERVSLASRRCEDSLFAAPAGARPAAEESDSLDAPVSLAPLAAGVWAADQEDVDSRSLIVEFGDHLAVIECAVGSANGERLVDAIRRRWPDKPIRWFLFSHHHPHYAGGLRALVAAGATVVTTPGNEAFVRGEVERRFTIAPDRLARARLPLALRTFERRFELADSTNRLIAVDIGARSDHTDEFVVFWLPRQRVVFEAEQGWIAADGAPRASRRARGFIATLDSLGLSPDRFVQSWPMRGLPRELTRHELEALIRARGD